MRTDHLVDDLIHVSRWLLLHGIADPGLQPRRVHLDLAAEPTALLPALERDDGPILDAQIEVQGQGIGVAAIDGVWLGAFLARHAEQAPETAVDTFFDDLVEHGGAVEHRPAAVDVEGGPQLHQGRGLAAGEEQLTQASEALTGPGAVFADQLAVVAQHAADLLDDGRAALTARGVDLLADEGRGRPGRLDPCG